MKMLMHKYGLFIGLLILCIFILMAGQWYGDKHRFQRMGEFTKRYLEEEVISETVVFGNHFEFTKRDLNYMIAVEQFRGSNRPDQEALSKLIEFHVALAEAQIQEITVSKKEIEQRKKADPLEYLGVSDENDVKEFFSVWESEKAGRDALEYMLVDELIVEKYWTTEKNKYFKQHEDLEEQQQETLWQKEKATRLRQMVEREEITNRSSIICEKYDLKSR